MAESRNETLEAARQALVVAADKLLQAAEMEERNEAIRHGARGKAWDGAFVRREKLAAMEAVRAALSDNIGKGSIVSETERADDAVSDDQLAALRAKFPQAHEVAESVADVLDDKHDAPLHLRLLAWAHNEETKHQYDSVTGPNPYLVELLREAAACCAPSAGGNSAFPLKLSDAGARGLIEQAEVVIKSRGFKDEVGTLLRRLAEQLQARLMPSREQRSDDYNKAYDDGYQAAFSHCMQRQRIDLGGYINVAGISAADVPHVVVEKLQRAIDATAELRRCQDGQPCKKPGECEARGKCHVFKGTPMEGLTITTNDLLNEARCKFAMPSNTTYPSRGAANEVRRFILSLASAYERALILLDATQKNYVRSHVERIPNIDHLTVQELQALQGKVLLLLQHRVLGDPSQGVVFPPERTAP